MLRPFPIIVLYKTHINVRCAATVISHYIFTNILKGFDHIIHYVCECWL
jgi:hypothetical protein